MKDFFKTNWPGVLIIVMLLFGGGLIIRNNEVFLFKTKLAWMASDYSIKHKDNRAYIWFADKHSYIKMLFSFKPMEFNAWFTPEEMAEITK